ncbi:hypothetical protein VTN49DRAFT_6547 [Thermomyces lanuginosus]|uniref:mitochondrial 54S ribosomal protein bL32m n=1 Tax=Thermomyces lanuginosus TaxID=5541 RepID=UPI003743FB9C
MAALRVLPIASRPLFSSWSAPITVTVQQWPLGAYSALPARVAESISSIPGLLSGLWDSVLRAVPKKKTSHMKKRHRQMAGKALKDVKSLNTCPACGSIKRAHVLCSNCVKEIKEEWQKAAREAKNVN